MTISLFTWGIGEGMFIYFQPIALQNWGADPAAVGRILALMGIAMAVAQIPAGYLADRVGPRPVMWASWLLGTAAAWMMALSNSLNTFTAGLLVYGLTSFVVAPMNAYISSVRGKWSVGRALTMVSAMFHLGAVIGPVVGGALAERMGLHRVYTFSAVIFILSTAVVLMARRQPVEVETHASAHIDTHLLRNTRFLGIAALAFLAMFATYLPQPLTSMFLQNERGVSLGVIGTLGSVGSLGNALVLLALGRLNSTLAFVLGQALVGLFALALWQGTGASWFGVGYFFIGGYRLMRVMLLALVRPLVRASEIGVAFGIIETLNALSVMLAPLAAGALYEIDPVRVYPVSAGLIALSVLASLGLFARRRQADQANLAAGAAGLDDTPEIAV